MESSECCTEIRGIVVLLTPAPIIEPVPAISCLSLLLYGRGVASMQGKDLFIGACVRNVMIPPIVDSSWACLTQDLNLSAPLCDHYVLFQPLLHRQYNPPRTPYSVFRRKWLKSRKWEGRQSTSIWYFYWTGRAWFKTTNVIQYWLIKSNMFVVNNRICLAINLCKYDYNKFKQGVSFDLLCSVAVHS